METEIKTKKESVDLNHEWLKRRYQNLNEITIKSILQVAYEDGFNFQEQRVKQLEEENKKLRSERGGLINISTILYKDMETLMINHPTISKSEAKKGLEFYLESFSEIGLDANNL